MEGMLGEAASLPILSLRKLSKSREKGGMRFDLRIPALDVYAGEFLAIVGQSGCGKSTLLDMLGLVLRPDAAERFTLVPRLKTRTAVPLPRLTERRLAMLRRREIGYVLQSGGLLPYLSVQENIMLPCRLNGYPEKASSARADELAAILGIAEQMEKKPAFLSGGQRQRVAIARALSHGPGLVLADEPTAAVDKLTAIEIRDAFRRIAAQQNVALVMVTHDRELIRGCADKTVTFTLDRPSPGHIVSTLTEATDD
ncbi:ABC transporter ATP-binding protein [Desulfovibrio sp. OttesenSCG-928-G15]|nr:ABC transporter ATP-binding protein [Desulfovibrio sp. OttesenSCG-928-G15]